MSAPFNEPLMLVEQIVSLSPQTTEISNNGFETPDIGMP